MSCSGAARDRRGPPLPPIGRFPSPVRPATPPIGRRLRPAAAPRKIINNRVKCGAGRGSGRASRPLPWSCPSLPALPAALPPEKPFLKVPRRSHENCLQPEATAALRTKQSHLSAFSDPLVSKLSCARLQVPSRCGFEAVGGERDWVGTCLAAKCAIPVCQMPRGRAPTGRPGSRASETMSVSVVFAGQKTSPT